MSDARLAVWGDPIAHSKSPLIHNAAYRALGLDWEYGRQQVDIVGFAKAFSALDDSWRGLSLTMPLKEVAHAAATSLDPHARLTGAVNTLLLGSSLKGFNTDVGGIIDAFTHAGVADTTSVRILGAGATAASALVAAHDLGARRAEVRARRQEAAAPLLYIGAELGIEIVVHPFEAEAEPVDATIATLPSGTSLAHDIAQALTSSGGVLFDAAYAPWPSSLAAGWTHEQVISGFEMLLYQAVRQIRIFLQGAQEEALPEEDAIVAIMRSAAMGD